MQGGHWCASEHRASSLVFLSFLLVSAVGTLPLLKFTFVVLFSTMDIALRQDLHTLDLLVFLEQGLV